jgi:hypothetical protein
MKIPEDPAKYGEGTGPRAALRGHERAVETAVAAVSQGQTCGPRLRLHYTVYKARVQLHTLMRNVPPW